MLLIFGWPLACMCPLPPRASPSAHAMCCFEIHLELRCMADGKAVEAPLTWLLSLCHKWTVLHGARPPFPQWYNGDIILVSENMCGFCMWANGKDPWKWNIHLCHCAEIIYESYSSTVTILPVLPWASNLIALNFNFPIQETVVKRPALDNKDSHAWLRSWHSFDVEDF